MKAKSTKWLAVIGLLFGLSLHSMAAVCVEIEKAKDSLSEKEQNVSSNFIEAILSQEGLEINNDRCNEKYFVYHLKLGNSVTVVMSNASKTEKIMAASMEELPAAYSQLVRKLTGKSAETRENVTLAQAKPKRIKADDLWYFGLGYGVMPDSKDHGVVLNFGYRYELDALAVDFSFNFLMPQTGEQDSSTYNEDDSEDVVFDMRIGALYYAAPQSSSSVYLGAGLGYGSMAIGDKENTGLSVTGILGVEFLRASTIRMFIQLTGSMPTYKVNGNNNPYFTGSLNIAY